MYISAFSTQIIITKTNYCAVCKLLLQIIHHYFHPENIYKAEADNCSLLQNVQTGSEAHPASYSVGTLKWESFLKGKAAGT
jgi:hypothetical protein